MVIITCTKCNINIEMPNKRFKMCEDCSRQKRLDRCKTYKLNNKEHVQEYNKEWKSENKEQIKLYNKEYNIENRDAIQIRQNKQHRERRKTDMKYKMSLTIIRRIQKFFNLYKISEIEKLIGISLDDYIKWIEINFTSKMNWDNHGEYWHIDHVIPCEWFDLSSNIEDRIVCSHWSNTRPLEKGRNMSRKNNCCIKELLNQEISAKYVDKSVSFKPLVTKLLVKTISGSS
jgi:hypothetical protein